jgi:enoyl-CoA hydratase/carnithine racemase
MLEIARAAGTQTWTMQFGSVNAIDPVFLAAFEAALDEVSGDESVAAVIVTSGLQVFSAGADASWMATVVREHGKDHLLEEFRRSMDRLRNVLIRMRRSDVLFIAALNGHTLAGGLELAVGCDLRFAADHERIQIGVPEMKLFGVMPSGGGGAQFLSRLMGPARALDFILSGESCTPARAFELGIVERVYPPEELLERTQAFAVEIAGRAGRIGIGAAKRSILDAASLPVYEGLEVDRIAHWDSMRRGGFLPGLDAFIEQFE